MIECSAPLCYCKLTTSLYFKVLVALKQLQSSRKHYNGADLNTLVNFMAKKYQISGDICSQVENALQKATQSLLVHKGKKDRYSLIVPAAALHYVSADCIPEKLEELRKTFNSPGYASQKSKKVSIRSSCFTLGNKKKSKLRRSKKRDTSLRRSMTRSPRCSRSRSRSRARSISRSRSRSIWKDLCSSSKEKNSC